MDGRNAERGSDEDGGDSSPMDAEFGTVAGWTADAAADLGPEYHLPAACRGSGSPGAIRWLIERLQIGVHDRMLDCGAGLGGPAAFAAQETGVRPVVCDPQAHACRGARLLFGLPAVQADSRLPFRTASMDVVWSLGVLCTVDDQPLLLSELRRVLAPGGRLGLLVYVAEHLPLSTQPAGNDFPTDEQLRSMLADAGFTVVDSASMGDMAVAPPAWTAEADAVQELIRQRHGDEPQWDTAAAQAETMGRLIGGGELTGRLLVARPS